MNHGSLFSGIGGFDLASQWMNWNNIFSCEKDEWCRKVLSKNFPKTLQYQDIKQFNAKPYNGTIDIISGGFPCQPFSVAGQRKGKEDDRYLWEEMLRIINEIQPAYVVCENVTGIIGMALDTVLSDLEAEDYTTETFIIPACGKNAWHRRDRVWIVAYTNSLRRNYEQKENREPIPNKKWNDTTEKQGRRKQQCGISESGIISSNTDNTGRKEQRQPITNGKELFAPKCSSWWETEPGMGRKINGFSSWLDSNLDFVFISHYCIFVDGELNNYTNGQTNKKRTKEVLQNLRSRITEAAFQQWAFRGYDCVFTEAALQSYMRKFEEGINEAWLLMEGKEAYQNVLRSLRTYDVFTSSSHRPGQGKQRPGEYSDTLQTLSRFLTHSAKKAWDGYCRQNGEYISDQWDSAGYWELGTNRVANGVSGRVDRLKQLGNAIVPQVAYEIFKAIAEYENLYNEPL